MISLVKASCYISVFYGVSFVALFCGTVPLGTQVYLHYNYIFSFLKFLIEG